MKICFINPTIVLRRPIVELSRLLADKGHQVSLLFPIEKKKELDKTFHFNKLLEGKVNLIPIPSIYNKKLRFAIPNIFYLYKKAKEVLKENDIVHIWEYFYPYDVIPLIIYRLSKSHAKVILTTDGFVGYSYRPENKLMDLGFRAYTSIIARRLFNYADKLTTYSEHIRKYAKEAGLPYSKFKVISTGINCNSFRHSNKDIRKEFGIPRNACLVTFIGMFTERKRPEYIINAAKKLVKKYNVYFLIAGEGYLRDKILEATKKLGISDRFILTEQRPDVADILNASDIFFLPSVGEGLPGIVMEAAILGVPSVATWEGGTPDLIIHNKTGFMVKIGEEEQYPFFLEKLIKSPTLRKKMGKAAKQHIKNFDWSKVLKDYEEVYEELR